MDRIPILRLGKMLLVTIQVEIHDRLATALGEDLAKMISKTKATGVLIEISAVETVDSFIARVLGDIAQTSQVLGAETVLVGMQPAVAITLVEMGISLPGVRTALDAERGLELLRRLDEERDLAHRVD